jgi:thiol:disulfide interchange protein DsbC
MKKIIMIFIFATTLMASNIVNVKGVQVDLDKTIKIGNGKMKVIEFGDPECPACRRSEEFLKNKDITRYVVLSPLPFHKLGKKLSYHVMCSKNPELEFSKAINGELDHSTLYECPTGKMKIINNLNILKKTGIKSVPTFVIDGEVFEGLTKEANEKMKY